MSARDLELLSAYVDGELSEKERLEIEQKIKLSPFLQQELSKLQKLKVLSPFKKEFLSYETKFSDCHHLYFPFNRF